MDGLKRRLKKQKEINMIKLQLNNLIDEKIIESYQKDVERINEMINNTDSMDTD